MSENWNDAYDEAMNIQTPEGAAIVLDKLVARCVANSDLSPDEAIVVERANIGYWGGFRDNETRERIERLFQCQHPHLGAIAETGPLTFQQCLEIGRNLGRQMREASCG